MQLKTLAANNTSLSLKHQLNPGHLDFFGAKKTQLFQQKNKKLHIDKKIVHLHKHGRHYE